MSQIVQEFISFTLDFSNFFFPVVAPSWPFIPWITTTMSITGGWSIFFAEVALMLRFAVILNDVIMMSFASSAEEQKQWAAMMEDNINGIWAPLLIFAPTKFMQKFGKRKPKKPQDGEGKKTTDGESNTPEAEGKVTETKNSTKTETTDGIDSNAHSAQNEIIDQADLDATKINEDINSSRPDRDASAIENTPEGELVNSDEVNRIKTQEKGGNKTETKLEKDLKKVEQDLKTEQNTNKTEVVDEFDPVTDKKKDVTDKVEATTDAPEKVDGTKTDVEGTNEVPEKDVSDKVESTTDTPEKVDGTKKDVEGTNEVPEKVSDPDGDVVKEEVDGGKSKEEFKSNLVDKSNKIDQDLINSQNTKLPEGAEIRGNQNGTTFEFMDTKTGESIGLTLMDDNGFIEIAIYRKGLSTKLGGKQVFTSLIENYRLHGFDFKGIRGLWNSKSTNTEMFNDYLKSLNKETFTRLDFENAALETWTGRQSVTENMTNVKVDVLLPESGPPFTKINVTFTE